MVFGVVSGPVGWGVIGGVSLVAGIIAGVTVVFAVVEAKEEKDVTILTLLSLES